MLRQPGSDACISICTLLQVQEDGRILEIDCAARNMRNDDLHPPSEVLVYAVR